MKRIAWPLALVVAFSLLSIPSASASHDADSHSDNMEHVGNFDDGGEYRNGSDLAFYGDYVIAGNLDPGGFRIINVKDPSNPVEVGQFVCAGSQNDVSIFRKLVFVSVDGPRDSRECDSGGAAVPDTLAGDEDASWEGIRVVSIADPQNPVQLAAVYTDCGSHTHTLVPDLAYDDPNTRARRDPRVLIYVLSYPLGGQGVRCNALSHRKISVVEVPLRTPEQARVISTPSVSPAVGCHDVTVFLPKKIAGAACLTESQLWDISDPANPEVIQHIYNPLINIHHSTVFDWDAETLVIGDELGGAAVSPGCLTAGHAPIGALWFYSLTHGDTPADTSAGSTPAGFYQLPQVEASALCTAHNFNTIPLGRDAEGNTPGTDTKAKDILVSAWYEGGTTVVDFTDPSSPEQIGFYLPEGASYWSSYWHNGLIYANAYPGDRGFDVFRIEHPSIQRVVPIRLNNPQTMGQVRGVTTPAPAPRRSR